VTIAELWEALQTESRSESGWHLRRVDPQSSCDLFAVLRQPGAAPGLLLEVPAEAVPPDIELPRSRGFAVEPKLVGPSHGGTVRFSLWLREAAFASIFPVLCENVASVAVAEPDPSRSLRAWIGRLLAWQDFMARHGPDGLTDEAALGLLGELIVLQQELAPRIGLDGAIRSWAGPRGEPNDFELPGGFLEVKTTAQQVTHSLHVSSVDQLDDKRGRILLVHQRMHLNPAGDSLSGAVDALRRRTVLEAPASLRTLDQLLLQAGYLDAHAALYRSRFSRERMTLFAVDASFPRIMRADLRAGVRNCAYEIDLASCSPITEPDQALTGLVKAGTHG
jgi:hypothetical protein